MLKTWPPLRICAKQRLVSWRSQLLRTQNVWRRLQLLGSKQDVEVSIVMGVPQNGWFIRGRPIKMDDFPGTPILGNHHVNIVSMHILWSFTSTSASRNKSPPWILQHHATSIYFKQYLGMKRACFKREQHTEQVLLQEHNIAVLRLQFFVLQY